MPAWKKFLCALRRHKYNGWKTIYRSGFESLYSTGMSRVCTYCGKEEKILTGNRKGG